MRDLVERLRRLRRAGLIVGFGLLIFFISFVFSFPYDRIKDQIIAVAATQNLDVEVGSAGPALGLGIKLKDVSVRTRPEPGKKASRLDIPVASIGVSPLAQMRGETAFSVDMEALSGEIDADVFSSKTRGSTKVKTSGIAMAELPGVREAINLPLGGKLDLEMDINFPNNRNSEAKGTLHWKCAACAVGDGKEKLKVAGNPLLAEGVSLPRIRLGDFVGKVNFDKGLGKLAGVQARSPDGEIYIDGEIRMGDTMAVSYLDLYVRFKMSEALLRSSDKLKLMLQLMESMGKRDDGFYGFRVMGTLAAPGPIQWSKTSPFDKGGTRAAAPTTGGADTFARRPAAAEPVASAPAVPPVEEVIDPLKNPQANMPRYQALPRGDGRGAPE